MGYDDERPVEVGERLLELLDRLEVQVIRRLVEDEAVDAAGRDERELGARTLAGRERGAGPNDVVGAEAELGQEGAGGLLRQPRRRAEFREERRGAGEAPPLLVDDSELD